MGSRRGARELTLRWTPRVAVLVGLAGLLAVGWQYSQYVSILGDDPCRSRGFCDERAITLAQRGLFRWYLGFVAVTALGLAVTLARRSWNRRDPAVADETMPTVRHAVLAGLLTFAWLGWLAATFVIWLFGGAPFVTAVAVVWLVGLTWALDRLHRRAVPTAAPAATLLASGAAAVVTIVGALAGVGLLVVVQERWAFLLPPVGMLVGVTLVTAVARTPAAGGVALAVSGSGVAALACALVVGVTEDGRDSLRSLRAEFAPAAAGAPTRAAPEPPSPAPDPLPTPSPTTRHTESPVRANRPCAPTDLTLEATGWDSAMGRSAVTIVATNESSTACWLEGYPSLRLLQGGSDLRLEVGHAARGASGQELTNERVGVLPGGRAGFGWWWKGYRQQADQHTPQTVVLGLRGGEQARLELTGNPYLVDVIEAAKVDVTPWGVRAD